MTTADGTFLPETERRRLTHSLRNSLGAMLSATEILERHYKPDGREARLFRVLLEEIARLGKLIDDQLGRPSGQEHPPKDGARE